MRAAGLPYLTLTWLALAPAAEAHDGGVYEDGGVSDDGGESEATTPPPGCRKNDRNCAVITFQIRVVRGSPREGIQLKNVIEDLRGKPANADTLAEAERRLEAIGRYTAASCRMADGEERGTMHCGVFRQRTIRRVKIEGLPIRLLETDLRKRIFLRGGEILPSPGSEAYDRITRQEARVVEYLERQGYYGARVRVVAPKFSEDSSVDVAVRIEGGDFIEVRKVSVTDPGPLFPFELEQAFLRMCLAPDGFLDAFETLTASCLTRDQLQATRDRVEARLRRMGYPEARVRVRTTLVDAESDEDRSCRHSEAELKALQRRRLDIPPRCADLEVAVLSGPRLEPVFEFAGEQTVFYDLADVPLVGEWFQPVVDLGFRFLRGFRRSFSEPLARAVQVGFQSPIESAPDSDLYLSDLKEVLTFDEARSVDVHEAERTRQAIEERLAQRGHFNARVRMRYEAELPESPDDNGTGVVRVIYTITPGPVAAVTSVSLKGLKSFSDEQILDQVTLETRPRPAGGFAHAVAGLGQSGFVSPRQLDADAERLMDFYESRGHLEVNVGWEGFRLPGGGMEVRFLVDEGPVFRVAEVQLVGGAKQLMKPVLSAVSVCATGVAKDEDRPPAVPADCKGSAFLQDELETDEKRILNIYAANGFPYSTADVEAVGFTDEGAVVEIRIRSTRPGEERPRPVKLGEVFVDGNEKTDKDVLLREMSIDAANLRPVQIAEGITRLRRTGLYNRVDVEYIGIADKKDQVHLRIKVEERPSITWDGSLAFSTDRYFSMRTELRNRNLLGRMLELSGLVDFGLFIGRHSRAELSLRWPRFLGLPLGFRLTGPGVIYDDRPVTFVSRVPITAGPGRATTTWWAPDIRRRNLKLFSTASVDYKHWQHIDLVVGLDYEFRLEWDDANAHPIEPLSLRALTSIDGVVTVVAEKDPLFVSTFSPWIHYRNIDNPFDPTRGGLVEASLRFGTPLLFNEEWLGLGQLRGAYYFSFWRITLGAHGRTWLGYAYGAPGRKSTMLQQNLVALGGDRSVRGFPRDRIGVAYLPALADLGEDVTYNGHLGLVGVQGNLEARILVIKDLLIGDLKLAAFTDFGVVTHTDEELVAAAVPRLVGPSDLLVDSERLSALLFDRDLPRAGWSVGAGVRYVLPVGPLSVDFACSVLDRPAPERCGWHLQLGYAF